MRKFVIALFLTVAAAVAQPTPAQSTRPPSPSLPQEIHAAFWTMQSGWYTELVIRNNYSHESLAVTPVLRTFSGNEVPLPAVTLGANEVKGIDLREALPKYAPQLLKSHGNYGSVVFRFNSPTIGSIFAFTMVHSEGHPFAFHFDAEQRLKKFDGGALETIWWLPKPSTDGLLVLSNASSEPVAGELQFSDAAGKTTSKQVAFGPRQTRAFNLREEFNSSKGTSSYGGLRFVVTKGGGDLQPIAFIYDETDGFSAVLKTFHHPENAPEQNVTLRAPMMALATPDPALGFPEETKLVPRVYLRNTTGQAVSVNGSLNWKSGTSTGTQPLSVPRLEAGQTYLLQISELQKQGSIPADANWGTVSFSYQGKLGDVIPIAASYETEGRFGVQTPFSHQITRYWKGGRWEVDPVHNSLITIGNGGDEPTTAAVTFYYNGGKNRYELPKRKLAAGEQMWVDLGKIIFQQIPDIEGRTIPLGTTFGAYDAVDLDHKAIGQLYEGKIIVDKKHGHAAYGCMHCCGYWETYILPSSKSLFTSSSSSTVVLARDCNNYEMIITELASGWHSADTQIATVDTGGIVSGQGAGSTSVDSYQYLASQNNYDCSGDSFYQDQSVSVKPVISGPNTVWWFNGQTPSGYPTSITLTSSAGGSTTWSVTAGATKVSLSTTIGTAISVSSSGTAFSGGNGNDISIVATANGVSSNPFTLTTRKPEQLISPEWPIDYPSSTCQDIGGLNGYLTYYFYRVLDQLGSSMPDVGINEYFPLGKLDIVNNDWSKPTALGSLTDENGDTNDIMCKAGSGSPQPIVPQNPLSTYGIDVFSQYWCIGTSNTSLVNNCLGVRVQTNTFSRWIDHARPTNITTP